MAFMGSFEARKGVWGGFTDVVYVDLGQSKSGFRDMTIGGNQLPADASANANYDLKGTAWTLAGSYRAVPDVRSPVDVFAGARMLDIKQTLGWQLSGNVGSVPLPGRSGNLRGQAAELGRDRRRQRSHGASAPSASGSFRITSTSAPASPT